MDSELVLADLGHQYLREHKLRRLRERYGFSRSAQAHMIGVSPTALRDWERGGSPSRISSRRVAQWYQEVEEFEHSIEAGVFLDLEIGALVHVTNASQQLAMSYGTIVEKCREGMLRCVDLGPLGLYISKAELAAVT